MELKIGNVFLTMNDIIFSAIILILLILALLVNYKIFKKIKNTFMKILFAVEFFIRCLAVYYIFYYFILILALNSSLIQKIIYGLLFVVSLFIPVIPELILIFFLN